MDKERFDQAFEHFIEDGDEKITPKTFFEVPADIEKERAQRTVELRAFIDNGKLKFLPTEDISVHDNEIILGNQRILIKIVEIDFNTELKGESFMTGMKKVTLSLPHATVEKLEQAVPAGQRSRFIAYLINGKLQEMERQKLRNLMVECCEVMYEENLRLEREFHPLEEEVEKLL